MHKDAQFAIYFFNIDEDVFYFSKNITAEVARHMAVEFCKRRQIDAFIGRVKHDSVDKAFLDNITFFDNINEFKDDFVDVAVEL